MREPVPTFDQLFRRVIGLPCWNVRQGYGSFLTFEFGNPSLEIREPRHVPDASPRARELLARRRVTVVGEWHLWIYCCGWRIACGGEELASWDSDEERIRAACQELNVVKCDIRTLPMSTPVPRVGAPWRVMQTWIPRPMSTPLGGPGG